MMLLRALGRRQAGLALQGLGRAWSPLSTCGPLVAFRPLAAFSSLGTSGPLVAFSLQRIGGPLVTSSVRSYNTEGRQGDLASRTLVLESKRFYLDVKENQRGRFIKVAEISTDGRRNQIQMAFSTAAIFSQNLVTFIEFYQQLGNVNPENLKHGELKSEVMVKDNKKYHMDLKENASGRFLEVSETFTTGNSRFQVFIPAEGMAEFQENLGELIDEYDNGDAENAPSSPQNLKVRNASGRFQETYGYGGAVGPGSGWDREKKSGDKVVVRGLADTCTWHTLKDGFSHAGDIKFADMKESGVGLIRFGTEQDAERAVAKMNGQTIEGREVKVELYI